MLIIIMKDDDTDILVVGQKRKETIFFFFFHLICCWFLVYSLCRVSKDIFVVKDHRYSSEWVDEDTFQDLKNTVEKK